MNFFAEVWNDILDISDLPSQRRRFHGNSEIWLTERAEPACTNIRLSVSREVRADQCRPVPSETNRQLLWFKITSYIICYISSWLIYINTCGRRCKMTEVKELHISSGALIWSERSLRLFELSFVLKLCKARAPQWGQVFWDTADKQLQCGSVEHFLSRAPVYLCFQLSFPTQRNLWIDQWMKLVSSSSANSYSRPMIKVLRGGNICSLNPVKLVWMFLPGPNPLNRKEKKNVH